MNFNTILSIVVYCSAAAIVAQATAQYAPVVLWHGMGDSCCNPQSMGAVSDYIKSVLPGVYVHSISVAENPEADRKASYFGNLNDEVALVCEQLRKIPELQSGFNAIGFSQGGQAIRAYVERCNTPRVLTLVTYGSQHGGVADVPNCADKSDPWCSLMRNVIKRGAYVPSIQHRLVQAQYFRDPTNEAAYLRSNIFLPDINNELPSKNIEYAANLKSLKRFVMIMFEDDQMVSPKESAWFAFYSSDRSRVIRLEEQELYVEDYLGLRQLNEEGRLVFATTPGLHMHISFDYLRDEVLLKYFAEVEVRIQI